MSLLSWLRSTKETVGNVGETLPTSGSEHEDELPTDLNHTEKPVQSSSQLMETELACLVPESLYQPFLLFPQRSFGNQQRAFCSSWYSKYPWLHYQEVCDSVLCFYCLVAYKRGLGSIASNKSSDDKFTKIGLSNWKKALTKFDKHQNSLSHRDAIDQVMCRNKDVGEILRKGYAEEKAENRRMLQIIITSKRYLGRQGLALRGHYKTGDDIVERGETDSNFIQLLKTRAEDNPGLFNWMKKSQSKFTSPDIQNEIISIMALMILRKIASELSGKIYTIMVDETTDLSNTEQMVLCLRYVDDDLEVHEEVIGLHSLESTSADMIVSTIQDILLRLNIRIDHCRGQCYDGAYNMSGVRSGVATQLIRLESRALYTHCYGHALNLATQDALKGVKIMKDALDTVFEITKLIKKSPKRDIIFQRFKDDVTIASPGLRVLCPTRWTVRAEALASIAENYHALQLTWDVAKDATRDTEMRARIGGVAAQMEKFDFFYGISLGRKLLNIVDNLSRSMQAKNISACDGQRLVDMTHKTLQSMRTDECFGLFWGYLECRRSSVDVSSPTLPRRFEKGDCAPEYPTTVQDNYRRIYLEAIELIVTTTTNRFQQKGFKMMQKLETVLTSVQQPQLSEGIKDVVEFYCPDFNHPDCLLTQLNILHTSTDNPMTDLESIVTHLKSLGIAERVFFSEVIKAVKIILVMPATNAVSERSFSALRRLKTWLRTTTTQSRLNWCMLLHVHKEKTDALQMISVGNEFISRNDSRVQLFGKF
ncbi:Zinc finger MYM-type protein 1-like [Oopsacas minuta]|uniref:Zinc finger MYM-type protein 1-like n=1 Tax=Oopsacas minuta TaxID=111878 RepID=A0AAV7K4C8_9METZ|nr:Zinc finger MYM-type protein 1-like [Oopsacas minuta]